MIRRNLSEMRENFKNFSLKSTLNVKYPLWTVGHYDPNGKWIPESDHDSKEEAAERVHYLNGSK
jgi:hypothetical protein